MDENTRALLERLLSDFPRLIDPLAAVADEPYKLYERFSALGWELEGLLGEDLTTLVEAVAEIQAALADAAAAAGRDSLDTALAEARPAITDAIQKLKDVRLARTFSNAPVVHDEVAEALVKDTLEWLLVSYLYHYWPTLYYAGVMLRLITFETAAALYAEGAAEEAHADDLILRYPVSRPTVNFVQVKALLAAPFAFVERVLSETADAAEGADSPQAFLEKLSAKLSAELADMARGLGEEAAESLYVRLDPLGVEFKQPHLSLADAGPIPLPLPADAPVRLEVSVSGGNLRLAWPDLIPAAEGGGLKLFEAGGFTVKVPGAGGSAADAPGTGLTLRCAGGAPEVEVVGGLRVEISPDVLTRERGSAAGGVTSDQVYGEARSRLVIKAGETPVLSFERVELGGSFHLGGEGGLAVKEARLTVEALSFPLPPASADRPVPFDLSVSGNFLLPGDDVRVEIAGRYADGGFSLATTGAIRFDNGIELRADGDSPVLSLEARPSRGRYAFAVGGAMKFPGGADGDGAVAVRGRMEIEAEGGGVRVNSFAAAGRVEDWPLWGDTRLENFSVGLGFERESFFARLACTVPLGGGFELALLDSPPDGWAETTTAPATGLTVTHDDGVTKFIIRAGMSLSVPADVLTGEAGDEPVVIEAFGSLEASTDAAVAPVLTLDLMRLRAERIHLGGAGGLVVENTEVELRNVERLFGAQVEPFFQMVFSGDLICPVEDAGGQLILRLRDACFTFGDAGVPPDFDFEDGGGLGFETGRVGNLPIQITEAFVRLKEGTVTRPLPHTLDPENLEITLSAEIALPVSSTATAIGAVRGLTVSIERGLPRVVVRGVTVGVSDMTIATMKFSGAMSLDNLTDPANLIIAGVLGGSYNGMGIKALVAFRMLDGAPTPLGVCLDVSGGQSGITIAYGFVIIGASGGVSYANTNADPCDFSTYVRVTQPFRKGRALPAGQPGKSAPSDRPVGFDGCPCKCPPPAMNILCQPHPDQERFPGRVILKFSSLDEAFLNKLFVPDESGNMVTLPEYLRGYDEQIDAALREGRAVFDPAALAGRVVAGLLDRTEEAVRALIPAAPDPAALVPPSPEALRHVYVDPAAHWKQTMRPALEQGVRELIEQAADAAVRERPSVYGVVRDVLYRGVPCTDETIQLTGTFSYTGVQVFLSVTGGVNISTTGSVGVLGYLNVFGLPVGQLRAFVTATGSTGDVDPSLCGDLRFEIGPLYLGQMSLLYDCPGCVTDFRDALVGLAAELGGSIIERVLRRLDEGLARDPRYNPLGDPTGTLSLLDAQQASSFIAQLYSTSFEPADAARVQDFAKGLLRATWASFNPRVVACGMVAIKLFGLQLGNSQVEARAVIEKDRPEGSFRLTALFGFSPIALFERILFAGYGLFAGSDSATMSVYVPLPGPEEVVLDGIAGRYNSPESFMAYLDAGLEKFLVDAALTFTYEFAPLGFKLVQAAGRVVMPHLTPHPESTRPYTSGLAGGTPRKWTNPDALSGEPPDEHPASRLEVLEAVLKSGKLADIFWKGELADIFPNRGPMSGALLQRDYFPHGGLIGASRVIVPGALYNAPRLDLLDVIIYGKETAARLKALVEFVKGCLEPVDAGTLAFYLPAPNPPKVLRDDPRATARRLIQSISDLDPAQFMDGDRLVGGDLYPLDLAFLRGHLEGQLLGIPVGRASVEFVPPGRGGGQAWFRIKADVGEDSWLHQFVPGAALEFTARQAPPEPIGSRFAQLLAELEARAGDEAALGPLFGDAVAALDEGLPKVSLEAAVEMKQPRAILKGLLVIAAGAAARLVAYSPRYEPGHVGEGPLAAARREGGIVFVASLRFGDMITVADAALSLTPLDTPDKLPRMQATLDVRSLELPGTTLRVSDAQLRFDSWPETGKPVLSVSGRAEPWRLGKFSIGPHEGPALKVAVETSRENGVARTRLKFAPARLQLPLFGESVVLLHGEAQADPFTLATAGRWDAAVSVEWLYLNSPYDPSDPPLLQVDGPVTGMLSGDGLTPSALTVTLDVPEGTSVTIFPHDPDLARQFTLTAPLRVTARGDGTFDARLHIPPLRFGALIIHGEGGRDALLRVRLTHYGLTVPKGARLTIDGVSAGGAIRLRQFVVNGNGDFSVTATTRTLAVGGFFKLSSGGIRVWREGERAGVELRAPTVRPLPDAAFTSDERFALGPERLLIESDGRFGRDAGERRIASSDFSLSGQLTFGYDPDGSPGPYLRMTDAKVRVRPLGLDFADAEVVLTPTLISAHGEQRIEVPDLLTVAGGVIFSYDVRSYSPSARFSNVVVRIPPLFEFSADVQLTPAGMSARGATIPWPGVPGLLEFTPGEWSFSYAHGDQSATLRTRPLGAKVFDQPVSPDADLVVTAKARGDYRADFSTRAAFGLAPLFEIGDASLALWREGASPQLAVSGTLRLLQIAGAAPTSGGGAAGAGSGSMSFLINVPPDVLLPRTRVTATNVATGEVHVITSDSAGFCDLRGIAAGEYLVSISAVEFLTVELTVRVTLLDGQMLRLEFLLQPPGFTQLSTGGTTDPAGASSRWLITAATTLRASEGAFEATLHTDTRGELALPAPLGRAASGLQFKLSRDVNGGFSLGLHDLRLNLLGNTLTLGGSVESDGRLRLTLDAGTRLPVGVFTVVLGEGGWIEFDLLRPSDPRLRAGFPGVRLESSIPGWPAGGFGFEGFGLEVPEFRRALAGLDWTAVPGTPAEFKVDGPLLVVNLSAAAPAARLRGRPVWARVIDRDGRAWFETNSGGGFDVPIDHATGNVTLNLPAVSDTNKTARDDCIRKAREDYPDKVIAGVVVSPPEQTAAIAQCWVNHPGLRDLPLPTLGTVTVNLGSFILPRS